MTVPSSKPKLLLISPFSAQPLSQGAVVRIHYLREWLGRDYEVWFMARGEVELDGCRVIPGPRSKWGYVFNLKRLRRVWGLMRQHHIRLVIASHLNSAVPAVLLKILTGCRLVLDEHNCEATALRGIQSRPFHHGLEWLACRLADRILCVSDADRQQLMRLYHVPASKLRVVPNGVSEHCGAGGRPDPRARRASLGLPVEGPLALFFGQLRYPPNVEALALLRREVLPRMRHFGPWVLAVAGLGGQRDDREAPLYHLGFVDDIGSLVAAADLTVVPLEHGGGTRLKILESLGHGTPVVSTPLGAAGLDTEVLGAGLRICTTWDAFASTVADMLSRPQRYLPSARFWETYGWEHIFSSRLEL